MGVHDIPKEIFNETIKSQILFEQYVNGVNQQVLNLLQKAQNEIVATLAKNDPTTPTLTKWKKARLERLNEDISDILDAAYGEAEKTVKSSLNAMGGLQATNTVNILNNAVGVDLFTVNLTKPYVESIVNNTMIDGKIIADWWQGAKEASKVKIAATLADGTQAVQLGMAQGESIGQLIRRITGTKTTPGVMDVSKREATALVRTSAAQVLGDTKTEVFKANADVLNGVVFVATLDKRTTPICRAIDGLQYDMERNPIGGHGFSFPGNPPLHWQCRTTLAPITKTFAQLAGPKSKLNKKQIKELDALPDGTRSSLGGQIPSDMNYNDWLLTQSVGVQKSILGPGRWKLWTENKLDMIDLVNNKGKQLTLVELQASLGDIKAKKLVVMEGDLKKLVGESKDIVGFVKKVDAFEKVDVVKYAGFKQIIKQNGGTSQYYTSVNKTIEAQKAFRAEQRLLKALEDPEAIVTFRQGQKLPVDLYRPIKGAKQAYKQGDAYSYGDLNLKIKDELAIPFEPIPGYKRSTGMILIDENTGKVYVNSPTNQFGGYKNSFPKGTIEGKLSPQEVAIKEVFEETGLQGEPLFLLGDYKKTTSVTRYFVGVKTGGTPAMMGWESEAVKLCPINKLDDLLNVQIDKKIASDFIEKYKTAQIVGDGDLKKGFKLLAEDVVEEKAYSQLVKKYGVLGVDADEYVIKTTKDLKYTSWKTKKGILKAKVEDYTANKIDDWMQEVNTVFSEAIDNYKFTDDVFEDYLNIKKMAASIQNEYETQFNNLLKKTTTIGEPDVNKYVVAMLSEELPNWETLTSKTKMQLFNAKFTEHSDSIKWNNFTQKIKAGTIEDNVFKATKFPDNLNVDQKIDLFDDKLMAAKVQAKKEFDELDKILSSDPTKVDDYFNIVQTTKGWDNLDDLQKINIVKTEMAKVKPVGKVNGKLIDDLSLSEKAWFDNLNDSISDKGLPLFHEWPKHTQEQMVGIWESLDTSVKQAYLKEWNDAGFKIPDAIKTPEIKKLIKQADEVELSKVVGTKEFSDLTDNQLNQMSKMWSDIDKGVDFDDLDKTVFQSLKPEIQAESIKTFNIYADPEKKLTQAKIDKLKGAQTAIYTLDDEVDTLLEIKLFKDEFDSVEGFEGLIKEMSPKKKMETLSEFLETSNPQVQELFANYQTANLNITAEILNAGGIGPYEIGVWANTDATIKATLAKKWVKQGVSIDKIKLLGADIQTATKARAVNVAKTNMKSAVEIFEELKNESIVTKEQLKKLGADNIIEVINDDPHKIFKKMNDDLYFDLIDESADMGIGLQPYIEKLAIGWKKEQAATGNLIITPQKVLADVANESISDFNILLETVSKQSLLDDITNNGVNKILDVLDINGIKKLKKDSGDKTIVAYLTKRVEDFTDVPKSVKKLDVIPVESTIVKKKPFETMKIGTIDFQEQVVKIANKTYDISDEAVFKKFKKDQTKYINKYAKSIAENKQPTKMQMAFYNNLDEVGKANVTEKIKKHKIKLGVADEMDVVPSVTKGEEAIKKEALNFANMKKYKGQAGSNYGGYYYNLDNPAEKYYIKVPANEEIARNELLASKLYELAGTEVPNLQLINVEGKVGIASEIVDGVGANKTALINGTIRAGVYDDYVVDAWLANWDVAGLGYDNLLIKNGVKGVRIDVGGSLRFRAQGTAKGDKFGNKVFELSSLRDRNTNPQSESIFKHITKDELDAGARKVLAISDDKIIKLVDEFGPLKAVEKKQLADTLIARKKYIQEQFPHIKVGVVDDIPKDLLENISDFEFDSVKKARTNGFGIPFDKEGIEDHQVLFWVEKDKAGIEQINATLKIREKILEALTEKVVKDVDAGKIFYTDEVYSDMYTAFRGIAMQSRNGELLRSKDIDRIRKSLKTFEKIESEIAKGVERGFYAKESLTKFQKHFEEWTNVLKEAAKKSEEKTVFKWSKDQTFKQDFVPFDPIKRLNIEKVLEKGEIVWEKKAGVFEEKVLKNGFAQETGFQIQLGSSTTNGWEYYYEADVAGARVRFWPDTKDISFANRGRVDVQIKGGANKKQMSKIIKALDEIGVDTARTTQLDDEYLYLRQILYARADRNFSEIMKQADSIIYQTLEDKVKFLRNKVSSAVGVEDITKLKGYRPVGTRQAFDNGNLYLFRPDLQGDEWIKFQENYKLYHNITYGELPSALDAILNSGGTMIPTTQKLRYGFKWGGMSPSQDMSSGGASYFFTRIKPIGKVYNNSGLVWNSKMISRLDAISYGGDYYGRVTDDFVLNNRASDISKWQSYGDNYTSNETIFKNGVSIFDELDSIVCNDSFEKQEVLKILKKHKITEWPDGRSLDEVVKIRKY